MPDLVEGAFELRASTFQRPVADDIDASVSRLKQMVRTTLDALPERRGTDCGTISESTAALAIDNAHQTID